MVGVEARHSEGASVLRLPLAFLLLPPFIGACTIESTARRSSPDTAAVDFSTGTHLVLLGTGTPNADPDASGPSAAVVVNGVAYLVDAGPGVVRRAAAAAKRGLTALEAKRLDRVFLTHLHSDHTVGLADLLLTPWVLERERPLEVYGPRGTADMGRHLVLAYDADIRRRIDGLQPQNETGWRLEPREIQPGVIYRDSNVTVTAIPVLHEEWAEAYGYRFESGDRVIVISGDCRASESLVAACAGCDILLHEVYSDSGFAGREPDWQRYHASAHTSATELAGIATRARPGLLVLYHQLLWGSTREQLLQEISRGYRGEVRYGSDLDIF